MYPPARAVTISGRPKRSKVLDRSETDQSVLVIIVGPSGVGKSTLARRLVKTRFFEQLRSDTTRAPRTSDDSGEYRFITPHEFRETRRKGHYVVWDKRYGRFYGLRSSVLGE